MKNTTQTWMYLAYDPIYRKSHIYIYIHMHLIYLQLRRLYMKFKSRYICCMHTRLFARYCYVFPWICIIQCCHIPLRTARTYYLYLSIHYRNMNECYNNTINIHTLSYIIHVQPLYCKQHNATTYKQKQ